MSSEAPAVTTPAPAAVDVDTTNFVAEVMQSSLQQVVVVDFWAPWCGPCKQLAPSLEKAIAQTQGKAKLVKINIDKCPQIAQQLRVQSIPAVFAFFNKQIVDGFMGALPESQINAWLAELIKATGAKGVSAVEDFTHALTQAQELLDAGNSKAARAIYADIYDEQPENMEALAGLLRAMLALGETDEAAALYAALPPNVAAHKLLIPVRSALELAAQTAGSAGDTPTLEAALHANENDHQARFDLALAHYAAGQTADALSCLLEIVRRDRKWNDEAARKQVLKILETLGFEHPLSVDTRKQLSTMIFS